MTAGPPTAKNRIVQGGLIILGTYGGLVPATFSLVFISALGDHNNSVKQSFWLAVGVTAFTVAVFHYGMQMQFPLFTWL